MQANILRYPKLYIRSKNELAKHLSHSRFSKTESLNLINDVIINYGQYWKDNKKQSEPEKDKYVRNAKGTPLGAFLDKVNKMVLAPHDKILPNFIFGGVKGMNHAKAAEHLLGQKRKRVALKMDITRFFEQISRGRVFYFFHNKCSCGVKASKIMADLCCVPVGPKNSGQTHKTIARGFATSSRLAVWCNLDTFIKLDYLVKKQLKGKDYRIAIYVDDIGITASRTSKEEMENLSIEITKLLLNSDKNQKLPVNSNKTKVTSHEEGIEHLGLRLYRNRLSIGAKTKSKRDKAKNKLKKNKVSIEEKSHARNKYRSLTHYKKYIESI